MARSINNPIKKLLIPVISGAILVGLLAVGTLNPTPPENVDGYFETVARTIDRMPYRVGNWTGRDLSSAPPQVLEMLRPNRVLHRGYSSESDRFRLVMVHCTDVRDMQGHYPMRCYPATGWSPTGSETVKATFAGQERDLTIFRFARMGDFGKPMNITIGLFFALPTQGMPEPAQAIYADLSGVRGASENRRRNLLGSAQIQIIFDSDRPSADVVRVLEAIAPALDPVIETVAEGLK